MEYGNFSRDGLEYEIHNPATPTPWINYLYNGRYFSLISNNGGGMSYVGNPLHGRITRYRINDVPPDRPGKYIYVRDRDSGAFWTLTWQPAGREPENYKTCHGFGYTRICSEAEEIAAEALFFVPVHDDQEIWKCALTNRSCKDRRLSVYAYVEFCLGHAHVDLINQCDDQHFNRVHFDPHLNALFATKTYWVTRHSGTQQQENQAWNQWAFFTSSEPVVEYETRRERFIGAYRNENNPLAMEQGRLTSLDTDYGNAVGVLRVDLDLKPGETRGIHFSLGVILKDKFESQKEKQVRKFRDPLATDHALEEVKAGWNAYFMKARAVTPDPRADLFINYWIPYQAKVAFDIGRVASFYYWGIGRGFGFRDTAQDTLAISSSDPAMARDRIHLLSRQMFSTGKVFHHFVSDGQGEITGHCDDPFWFILAVTDYIRETGDLRLLQEVEPFLDGGEGMILDHLMAVARRAGKDLGQHGLPIFGRGDWNDTLDYIGGEEGGESVWGGLFYAAMLKELEQLLQFVGRSAPASEAGLLRKALLNKINQHCWDGRWFLRAFGAGSRKIGSNENQEGKIFLNAQSWAVIAQAADQARLIQCMNSVKEELDTEFGPKICAPAYREIDPSIGLVTRCVPGKKENGAVFCHPVTWAIMAECMLGRGNRAFEYFKKTLPGAIDADVFCAEPYVYSQYITSNEHEEPGKASHSWQTGTAAWMKKVALEYILGIRATYAGLEVDPVIPSSWEGFYIERDFRGTRYCISVENPHGKERGVSIIEADGIEVEGSILPLKMQEKINVKVVM
ncbi:MAG: glycosyl transferase family 36 [Planctomycetota bacterium]